MAEFLADTGAYVVAALLKDAVLTSRVQQALNELSTDAEDWYDQVDNRSAMHLLDVLEEVSDRIRAMRPVVTNYDLLHLRNDYVNAIRTGSNA